MKYLLLLSTLLWFIPEPFGEKSITITFMGPESEVIFEAEEHIRNMAAIAPDYCTGQFELNAVVENDEGLTIVCVYSYEQR